MEHANGDYIPLATPFTDDGRALSEVRVSRQVRYWREQGAKGFYIAGESGEFLTVVSGERKAMLEIVHRECQGTLPVICNVSSLSTALSLDLAQHAARHGATAVFITPPYFGRFTHREILGHLKAVVGLAGLPVIVADVFGACKDGFGDVFDTMPKVEVATGSGFDEWNAEGTSVHAITTLAQLYPEVDRKVLAGAYLSVGPAPLLKSAFERIGIELGSPRSPKNPIDMRELGELLQMAA